MQSIAPHLLLLLGVLVIGAHSQDVVGEDGAAEQGSGREKRLISLFAVVNFQNLNCTATTSGVANGLQGTCLSATECSEIGDVAAGTTGVSSGSCASGFGVCCTLTQAACPASSAAAEAQIKSNSTYIANVGFPTTGVTAASTCVYTINYETTDICQLRLDFQTFTLSTGTNGDVATGDTFVVAGPTSNNPPTISGSNAGFHMYVETGRSTTQTTITVTTLASTTERSWNVKVDQIECNNLGKAPSDCTQYFTGPTGNIKSYNFPTSELTSQEMSYCIRKAEGFCKINYVAAAFSVGSTIAGAETTTCDSAAVYIPATGAEAASTNNFFCGTFLADTDGQMANGIIPQIAPFKVYHRSSATAVASTGFNIAFSQQGCNA